MQTKSTSFVAYYRVSTERQGRSGLGLEAQRKAVARYLASVGGLLLAEFTEVETGKRNHRHELQKALASCRRDKARWKRETSGKGLDTHNVHHAGHIVSQYVQRHL